MGDDDINDVVVAATGQQMNPQNATIIEFDFTPYLDHITFPFVFASEEYGTYQCEFSDAFAFLLTNNSTNTTTNLALVPGTDDPISVVTIRDGLYNAFCDPPLDSNVEYFDNYYGDLGVPAIAAPVNFNGTTVKMTAESDVTIGQLYHIKLVIADRNDSAFDSAIFIGKFTIGNPPELGEDLLLSSGNAVCDGEAIVLDANVPNPANYTFVWSDLNGVIPNETGSTLSVTTSGTYSVAAQQIGVPCIQTDTKVVEYYVEPAPGAPATLSKCVNTATAVFNLTDNEMALSVPYTTPHDFKYYLLESDALANADNNITTSTAFEGTDGQTIYVRVNNTATGCNHVVSFQLQITDPPIGTFTYPGTPYCSNGTDPLPTLDGVAGVFSEATGDLIIDATTGLVDLSSPEGTYTVRNTITASGGCAEVIAETTIVITKLPVATFAFAVEYCKNEANPTPTFTGDGVAGIFSAPTGLVFIDTTTGEIDLGGSDAGTYLITNTIAAANGCGEVTATFSVTITALPVAAFNYGTTGIFCSDGGSAAPTFTGGGVAGNFTANPSTLLIDASTGVINLASPQGIYIITNDVNAGICGFATATATITINAPLSGEISYVG
ncbi:choice-of-anchor L domain-containing protein [Flavobacterium sp. 3HN19-14]|uniref:choice-of-anchor L domain-containing protein n=1 Tax=Flavobacterium sp. 3HN19-14 TaxID=3448133 RepID=UPI003EDE99AC